MTTAIQHGAVDAARDSRRMGRGFWIVAAISFLYLFAVSAPSPLYGIYAAQWHFSPTTLTAVFGVYALTLLGTMLLAGSLSDALGRRPVIAAALVVQAVTMVLFLFADNVGWLYAARLTQGCATGLVTAAVSAALVDLQPANRPGLAPLVNATVPAAGLAVGALSSGALVRYAPAPTRLIYALLLAGFVALIVILLTMVPETVTQRHRARLGSRVGVERPLRRAFLATVPVLVSVWALSGLYLSLGPSLALTMEHSHNALLGGAVIFLLCGCGAVTGIVMRGSAPRRAMLVGCALLGTGVLITVASVALSVPALLYVGTVVSGCGFGAGFLGTFRTLAGLAEPERRSELITAIYVVAYLSFSVPGVIAGILTTRIGLHDTAIGYGLVVAALAWIALPATARHCYRC
ncbi:MFS family permease [Streptacidiphilus sp. MAP12-16]|uniref:MFS transporter n=1 Tax=Streptacidiphilus sp. MAP12-16 TaxID=3156300 RepID=UPI0035185CAD